MEHEMIDWLNEKGEVVGTIDKAVAHKDGSWHRSVHVWVINNKGEILLQKRCADKKFFPNVWDVSFAGHVGAGESSLISAIREGKEELGINVDTTKMKFLFTNKEKLVYKNITSNEFVDVYLLTQQIDIKDLSYQIEEVAGAKYIPLKQFVKLSRNHAPELLDHYEECEKLFYSLQTSGIEITK